MRGPIDFIVIGFKGNNFKGDVLNSLEEAAGNGTIAILDLALILKDSKGELKAIELEELGDEVPDVITKTLQKGLISKEDITEVGELIENDSSVGLLIIEQLWAKPLKKALVEAGGTLITEGRIHPEALKELEK